MCTATPKPVMPTAAEAPPTPAQQETPPQQATEQERLRQRQRITAPGSDTVLNGAVTSQASTTKTALGA